MSLHTQLLRGVVVLPVLLLLAVASVTAPAAPRPGHPTGARATVLVVATDDGDVVVVQHPSR